MTWAFDQPLAGNEKVILLALADASNDDGVCWPSVSRLAERAYVSERTVQRAIQSLIDGGYIATMARNYDNGRTAANKYLLLTDREREGDNLTPSETISEGEGDNLTEGDNCVTGEGDNCVTPLKKTKHRTVIEIDKTRASVCPMPEDFHPNRANQELAAKLNFSWPEVLDQIERMRNWAINAKSKGLKSDWQRFFNNWIRTAGDRKKEKSSNGLNRHTNTICGSIDEVWSILEAGEDRQPQTRLGCGREGSVALPGLREDAA